MQRKREIVNGMTEGIDLDLIFTLDNYWLTLFDIFIIAIKLNLPLIIFGRWNSRIPTLGFDCISFNDMDREYSYLLKIDRTGKAFKIPSFGIMKYKNRLKIKHTDFNESIRKKLFENDSFEWIEQYLDNFWKILKKPQIKKGKMPLSSSKKGTI